MRIDRLKLWNFKKFDDALFQFHPKFTVLIGDNATGKTSILDALATLLGTYLLRSGIPAGRSGLTKDEARLLITEKEDQVFLEPQKEVFVEADGLFREDPLSWKREIGDRGGAAKKLIATGISDRKRVSKGEDMDLPLLLYYGAGRLWSTHSKIKVGRPESRLAGYRNCLDPKSDHFLFEKWFKQLELAALQQRKTISALEAVRDAVMTCIPNAEHFYYDIANGQLMIRLQDTGLMPFNNLSDGYRNMVAMVADIAHRSSRLNPHLGIQVTKETSGVVLIDEIDRRWLNRKEAWDIALRAKERLERNDYGDFRAQITETASANGFWSVWMTVFNNDADMLRRLIEAFAGTCGDCFDAEYAPIVRPGGQC